MGKPIQETSEIVLYFKWASLWFIFRIFITDYSNHNLILEFQQRQHSIL